MTLLLCLLFFFFFFFFYFGIVFPERRELASAVVCASLGLLREQQEQLNFQTKDTKSSKRKERTKRKKGPV
jgi:hypothetical protein